MFDIYFLKIHYMNLSVTMYTLLMNKIGSNVPGDSLDQDAHFERSVYHLNKIIYSTLTLKLSFLRDKLFLF